MIGASNSVKTLLASLAALSCPAHRGCGERAGQGRGLQGQRRFRPRRTVRLTIVVTGGEDKKPVDSASVYVRYVEERKLGKDKKIEMNLKTNQSGSLPRAGNSAGKILIQVIADGWKTYGEYYEVNQTEQTINIALVRPPKWY